MNATSFRQSAFIALIVGMVLSTAPGGPTLAASDGVTTWDGDAATPIVCDAGDGCRIPYENLSNQKDEPFLLLGVVVDERHPRFESFSSALLKFPDARPCLLDSEKDSKKPNLLNFDWRKPEGGPALEVCLFRIASSLVDPELIFQWMKYHKLTDTFQLSRIMSSQYEPSFEDEPIFLLGGSWDAERYRKLRKPRSWWAKILGVELINGLSITFNFSESLKVVSVGAGTSSK